MDSYALSKVVIAAVSPLGTCLLLGALGVLLLGRARRTGATLVSLGLAWLGLWSLPAVSDAFVAHVEAPYPARPVESLPRADALVLLGGGVAPPAPGFPYPDLNLSADRVWHAARAFRAGKAALVVASGGIQPGVSAVTEAEAMALLLTDLGVPRDAILLETQSRNTRENADASAALLRERKAKSVLLVTSALHMPRAVAEFRRAGVEVVPAPADQAQPKERGLRRWLPSTGALDASGRAMKEVLGRVAPRS